MKKNYLDKIVTLSQLTKKVGKFPRKDKIAMCHGVFDLVHPGHIRHLVFAKSKTNKLIVSITSDFHIKKSSHRPYVPQQLRAENLAALEFVDYVLIDTKEKPLQNILKIKPDLFVKGYEYISGQVNPNTQEEINLINSYGGEFLYTPGDYVLSSSKIIENEKPDLSLVKLKSLLDGEKIKFDKIYKSLENFKNIKVLVVGDTIIDSYVKTSLIGSNAKTPTFSVKYLEETNYLGGAGVVAMHMKAAGANVSFCSTIGDDRLGKFVKTQLKKNGIKDLTLKSNKPTTEKKYFIADNYRLLKVDTVDNSPESNLLQVEISKIIKNFKNGIVIFSDFRHGIFNKESIPNYIKALNKNVLKVADSQVASRWGNILDFSGFDLITPNEKEARFSMADQDSSVRPLASALYEKAKCKYLILKLGSRGIITLRRKIKPNDYRSFFVIDALENNAIDPVGCGDGLLAYSSLGLYSSKDPLVASMLGSVSSALVSRTDGNNPVSYKKVIEELKLIEDKLNLISN